MRDSDEDAWHLYERSMQQRRLAPLTVAAYRYALENLSAALPDGTDLFGATEAHVEDWLAGLEGRGYSASSQSSFYRRAHAFYAWAAKREYAEISPMARMDGVTEPDLLIPLPDPADMAAVLEACKGRDWRSRRDHAMLRILLEAGTPRASELAALTLDRLDMRRDRLTIPGKGGKERTVPFGEKTGHALTLWLRSRSAYRLAGLPQVFFTQFGPMDRHAVWTVLGKRCARAGIRRIPPHHWRHYSAHEWMLGGGSEGDAMQLFGWRTAAMAQRYGAAAAASRAVAHAVERGQGDRI